MKISFYYNFFYLQLMTNFDQNNTSSSGYPTSNFAQENLGYQQNTTPPPMPNNYMVWAIVVTVLGLCSCIGLVLGIVGIVFASQVSSKYSLGDYVGAQKSANNAKLFSIIGLILDVIGIIINIIYVAVTCFYADK